MKKLALMASAAVCLAMASCSKEPLASGNMAAGPVTVTASVPSDIAGTKAVPSAPENHQLRCILVVDYPNAADTRLEQVADGTNNFSFTFTPQESGYTCLLWADYIDATASAAEGEYPDKYYDTQDLHNIGYVQTALADGSLFNNAACDAFYGTLAEGKTAVTLYRPFTRLTFKNADGSAVEAGALDISYSVYSGFNVMTGTSASTATISATDIAPAETGVWFYNYVFAPVDKNSLPEGNITLTKDSDAPKTIPTSGIPLDANADQGLTFTYGTSAEIEVGIEDEYGVTAPKVGDFFYSDGTWSTSLDNEKTVVGVIFALASDGGLVADDVPANYEGSEMASKDKVTGWVVAANATSGSPRFWPRTEADNSTPFPAMSAIPEGVALNDENDILGFKNTYGWYNDETNRTNYAAISAAVGYESTVAAPEGTSGWYMASVGQMIVLAESYATTDGSALTMKAVGTALQTLAQNSAGTGLTEAWHWCSTGAEATSGEMTEYGAYRIDLRIAGFGENGRAAGQSSTNGATVRPVLTF